MMNTRILIPTSSRRITRALSAMNDHCRLSNVSRVGVGSSATSALPSKTYDDLFSLRNYTTSSNRQCYCNATSLRRSHVLRQQQHQHHPNQQELEHRRCLTSSGSSDDDKNKQKKTGQEYHEDFQEQLAELQAEREALYGFTDTEKDAWSNSMSSSASSMPSEFNTINTPAEGSSSKQQHQAFIEAIEQARLEQDRRQELFDQQMEEQFGDAATNVTTATKSSSSSSPTPPASSSTSPLTHLTDDGTSIHMVDVGSKDVTKRVAKAQTKVIFPPEVIDALSSYNNNNEAANDTEELIGPKGPIFATAKVAGIMAAK